jgi:hypothetical protein
VQELVRLKDLVHPEEVLLVLDAATGQEAVNVATHFDKALSVTGAILTKLDGDARGGAALSFKSVTGKPIKFVGVGEKLDDFESFHPERMASRILGMGDVVSLVERAAEAVDMDEAGRMEEKLRRGQFSLEDMLEQMRAMKKLGPLESLVRMLPGAGDMMQGDALSKGEREMRRMEGIICSMTPQERKNPNILNAKRRQRIAKGSGTGVSEVNNLLNRFAQMQQMMKKMGKFQKMMGGGIARGLGGLGGGFRGCDSKNQAFRLARDLSCVMSGGMGGWFGTGHRQGVVRRHKVHRRQASGPPRPQADDWTALHRSGGTPTARGYGRSGHRRRGVARSRTRVGRESDPLATGPEGAPRPSILLGRL